MWRQWERPHPSVRCLCVLEVYLSMNPHRSHLYCVLFITDIRTRVPKLSLSARRGRQRSKLNAFGFSKDRWVTVRVQAFLLVAWVPREPSASWILIRQSEVGWGGPIFLHGNVLVQVYKTKWISWLCALLYSRYSLHLIRLVTHIINGYTTYCRRLPCKRRNSSY